MKPSDITLLRKELAKAAAENRNLQKKIFEIEATPTKRNTLLELEDDCLRRELAARDMRMETYENSDAPPPLHGFAVQFRARRLPKEDGRRGHAGGRT